MELFDILKASAGIPVDDELALLFIKRGAPHEAVYLDDSDGKHLHDSENIQLLARG
jgi:hypothetical protein